MTIRPTFHRDHDADRITGFLQAPETQSIAIGIALGILLAIIAWGAEPVETPQDWHGNSYNASNG